MDLHNGGGAGSDEDVFVEFNLDTCPDLTSVPFRTSTPLYSDAMSI